MKTPEPMTEERLKEIEGRSGRAMRAKPPAVSFHDAAQAAFASARDVPALVAEVRRLAEKLERIRTVVGVMWAPPMTTGNMASELARLRREVGLGEPIP